MRRLARLLNGRWPGTFTAEGAEWPLDVLVCRSLGVAVWVDGVTVEVPAGRGLTLVMVPRSFDDAMTVKRVAKQLRRKARETFDPYRIEGRPQAPTRERGIMWVPRPTR